ncbi:MAG: tRNA (guanosine(46)-N7)-methyltransferase TrmB [Bacteroidales bacterium]|nr:tRNA (guanosine(46)-N7)-methyltransferase TrmB [Bacteroidales bacterium]
MGHGKLKRFRENETFGCLLQPASSEVLDKSAEGFALKDHAIRGNWNRQMFAREQPIVLELGCGKGEYTIDMALRNPEFNYIGVDIKGARLWKGAKYATEHNLPNVAFLRTRIEFIGAFFAPGEVSEVWLTFSDPQMKSENSRLTSPRFLERYRAFMAPGGIVHLKTDSMFLHQYSKAMAEQNGLKILACTEDLYATDPETLAVDPEIYNRDRLASLYEVQTYYESMFLKQGLKITYLSFVIDREGPYVYPEFDADYWRSVETPRKTFNVL